MIDNTKRQIESSIILNYQDLEYIVTNDISTLTTVCSQIISMKQNNKTCCLNIGTSNFISSDAKKIFMNILLNSYDLIPGLIFNKENNIPLTNYEIDISNISTSELINTVNIFLLMIEKANTINLMLIEGTNKTYNNNFFNRYKMLIEGLKTTYEKGLILVRLLFRDQETNNILSKYYRLIQRKENSTNRQELFNELIFMNQNSKLTETLYPKKRIYKY